MADSDSNTNPTSNTATDTPDLVAEASDSASNAQKKIPAPQNFLTLKASAFAERLPYGSKDHIIANRIFRRVYNKHFGTVDEGWGKVPQVIIDSAVQELVEANPRLFDVFEGNWYLVWGLKRRHQGRARSRKWGEDEELVGRAKGAGEVEAVGVAGGTGKASGKAV